MRSSTRATILLTMLALGSPPSLATRGSMLRNKINATASSLPKNEWTTSRQNSSAMSSNVSSTTLRPERVISANGRDSNTVSQQSERKLGVTKSSSTLPYRNHATSTTAQFDGDQVDVTATARYTTSPTLVRGYTAVSSTAPSSVYQSNDFTSTTAAQYGQRKTSVVESNREYSTSTTTVPYYNVPSYQQSDLRDRGLKASPSVPSSSTSFPSRQSSTNDVSYASSFGSAQVDDKTSTLSTVNADQVVYRNKGTTRATSSSTTVIVNVLWNGPTGSSSTSTSSTPFTFSTPSSVNGTSTNGTIAQIDFKEVITAPEFKCPDGQKRGEDRKCHTIY